MNKGFTLLKIKINQLTFCQAIKSFKWTIKILIFKDTHLKKNIFAKIFKYILYFKQWFIWVKLETKLSLSHDKIEILSTFLILLWEKSKKNIITLNRALDSWKFDIFIYIKFLLIKTANRILAHIDHLIDWMLHNQTLRPINQLDLCMWFV